MNSAQRILCILLLAFLPVWVRAQDPGDELELDGILMEGTANERGATHLILDNTRTKIGRDFYDLFYKHWSAITPPTDTSKRTDSKSIDPADEVVITIEEVPAPGIANQVLISINDEPVWQQFVQRRFDELESDARYAVRDVRQLVADYQETQQLLKLFNSQARKDSGVP